MWRTKSAKPRKAEIRMQRASKYNKKTYYLENTKSGNRIQASGGHSQTKDHNERNQSKHRRKRARGTYVLSITEEGTRQDSKSKPAKKGHALSVKYRGRDSTGWQKKSSERRALTFCRA